MTEWVSEFDFRLSSSRNAGDYFLIYAAFTGFGPGTSATDVEVGVNGNQDANDPFDSHVIDSTGTNVEDVDLARDVWHHFTVHRVATTGVVDIYVNDGLVGSYSALRGGGLLAGVQIGDVSGGNFSGEANWDNFSIGALVPEPAAMAILLTGGALAISRRRRA